MVKEVLNRLRQNDLYLKPEKCNFDQQKTEFLGLLISANRVEMDPVKLTGVKDWPTPKKLKEVQAFIGFANFYRRFIKNFSEIARPLNNLAKKDTPFTWGESQQEAFNTLKETFLTAPILKMPNPAKQY